jgi:mannuronan 5-epimerase
MFIAFYTEFIYDHYCKLEQYLLKIKVDFSSLRYLLITIMSLIALIDSEMPDGGAAIKSSISTATNTVPSPSPSESCVSYDPPNRTITIKCQSASLTDIHNQLNDDNVLNKQADGVWLLNAGIMIDKGAVLNIDSKDDVKWLKIIADGRTAYPIDVSGSLKIDSVKVTSWDPQTNDYAISNGTRILVGNRYEVSSGEPRPYITVRDSATGTTNITNSEIAYLGYESGIGGGTSGLRYAGGDGSIIMNNNIHHLYFGFYSSGVGNFLIENNEIHDNGHYGLDPHTGTHDMVIRNNTVHDNGSIGIICSLNCYRITIEKNNVYNNVNRGIMFSRNMFDSTARDNLISGEEKAITISESHDNEIFNNTVSNSINGIDLDKESLNNRVHDNTVIVNPQSSSSNAIAVESGAEKNNLLYSNIIKNNIPP